MCANLCPFGPEGFCKCPRQCKPNGLGCNAWAHDDEVEAGIPANIRISLFFSGSLGIVSASK